MGHSKSADLWSLGIVMVEIIDGRAPTSDFSEDKAVEFIKSTKNIEIKNRRNVSKSCLQLVTKCLEYDRTQRITINEFLQVLSLD